MIVYNTTYHVDDEVQQAFINYIKNIHIKAVVDTQLLNNPRFSLIHAQHEESGASYSLQFDVDNLEILENWFIKHGQSLQANLNNKFGSKVCGFMTLLEEIKL